AFERDDGQDHLRAQRLLRHADSLRHHEVPRGVRGAHPWRPVQSAGDGGCLMTETKMVSLTIEGRAVQVPEGTSILEAAKSAGILVPHYCYHPSLPVAGSCRMCLVEVEKAPKLAPACATAAGEGQVVHVFTEQAREARERVLEFLLLNHPLDC